jgi:hypothetical protein
MASDALAKLIRALIGLTLVGCGTEDAPPPSYVCESLQAPSACPSPAPTYANVEPIFRQRCVGPCHSGTADGPWPLTTYEHIYDWKDIVSARLLDCTMPPLDGGVPITTEERLAILTWIACDSPE